MINRLFFEMIKYYEGDAKRIQHFTKVYSYAELIGRLESIDEDTLFVLKASALVHDIGIRRCEEKYGRCDGKLQEKEGPKIARDMLEKLGFQADVTDRVCYLVGHHHTYDKIEGVDYQILVEADFLVNMYEDDLPLDAVKSVYSRIFKTESGSRICREMFNIKACS